MKIALFIEDGFEQVVLTPETETEGAILRTIGEGTRQIEAHKGNFYHCAGGWLRQRATQQYGPNRTDWFESTIICLNSVEETKPDYSTSTIREPKT